MSIADVQTRRSCSICGEDVPAYLLDGGGRCDACHWDTYIPNEYEWLEHYLRDPTWNHLNAERSPSLGVEFLDAGGGRFGSLFNVPITWTADQRLVWFLAVGLTQEEAAERLGVTRRVLCYRLARVRSDPQRLMGGAGRTDSWFYRLPVVKLYLDRG